MTHKQGKQWPVTRTMRHQARSNKQEKDKQEFECSCSLFFLANSQKPTSVSLHFHSSDPVSHKKIQTAAMPAHLINAPNKKKYI
jgi:hypothetical protein